MLTEILRMSRSSWHNDKQSSRSELFHDDCSDGTAARTRPFSFDEIMCRRRNKKQSGDTEVIPGESENISVKDIAGKASDHSEAGRSYRKKSELLSVVVKLSSDDIVKESSRKKDNASMSEEKFVRRKDKENRESEAKSKATLNKDVTGKTKGGKDDPRGYRRRENLEYLSSDSENRSEKKHSRDSVGRQRYAERSGGKSEKETKRKHGNEDDERSREKSAVKKYDSGKQRDSEGAGRKEKNESSEFYNEGSRSKKRRSRSRERDKDRGRRSSSISPRSHKRASYNVREHGELSLHSSKDRSRRHQPDDDRNKISSNGSSSLYRRHGGPASGLGGYSPRKRRSEAAARTPSPPHRSPEKRNAGWDLPPTGAEINPAGSVLPNVQSNQTASSNAFELSSMASVSSLAVGSLSGFFPNAAIDSIQLTQSTRPMRRLYVENLPGSASEKAVMECLNNFLMSSGVNHIKGTQPCISCIIHKEKGQALVEFLTPEDASAALCFDGRSFSGSILKIRRPKDYVEVTTGLPEKIVSAFDSSSDVVRDSPYKIFVGGIAKVITSEMLREIACAFGPLKAFHFEVNTELNEPCAFLEYVDQSVTHKACAGLNGMRLGGQMLTVVLATPDSSSIENSGNSPFYGIPDHARPLLERPTEVLKLKNVLDLEGLSSLSELELEEILEDIRIECARFGSVKSVNIIKHSDPSMENCNIMDDTASIGQVLDCSENMRTENYNECNNQDAQEISSSQLFNNVDKYKRVDKAVEGEGVSGIKLTVDLIEDKMCQIAPLDGKVALEDPHNDNSSSAISLEPNGQQNLKDKAECHTSDRVDDLMQTNGQMEDESAAQQNIESEETNGKPREALGETYCIARVEMDTSERSQNIEHILNLENVFEPGCILVEYRRAEASSVAAHCLHGRLFDDRIVTVEYVPCDIYKAKFPK
ncbi:hypothetical protein NMG60_11017527 [Bertholletia excelsa]